MKLQPEYHPTPDQLRDCLDLAYYARKLLQHNRIDVQCITPAIDETGVVPVLTIRAPNRQQLQGALVHEYRRFHTSQIELECVLVKWLGFWIKWTRITVPAPRQGNPHVRIGK